MRADTKASRRTIGRCPDCGTAVEVQRGARRAGIVLPHGCPARACEYPGCRVTRLDDEMVQLADDAWYCPSHGLLVLAEDLVALYRVPGDADWTAIGEILGESLPLVLCKARTRGGQSRVAPSAAVRP